MIRATLDCLRSAFAAVAGGSFVTIGRDDPFDLTRISHQGRDNRAVMWIHKGFVTWRNLPGTS